MIQEIGLKIVSEIGIHFAKALMCWNSRFEQYIVTITPIGP